MFGSLHIHGKAVFMNIESHHRLSCPSSFSSPSPSVRLRLGQGDSLPIGVILGYIGIMKKKMETTGLGVPFKGAYLESEDPQKKTFGKLSGIILGREDG